MLARHNSNIYGKSPPYIHLGVLPNAENLVLPRPKNLRTPSVVNSNDVQDFCGIMRTSAGAMISPTFVERLFSLVKDNSTSMVNFLVIVIILVAETLVNGKLFTCPCHSPQNVLHGFVFLAAPAMALFVVGILVSNTIWILVTGCKYRDRTLSSAHKSAAYSVAGVVARSTIAPTAWLVYGFIDGNFYPCAKSSDPCNETSEEKARLRSESQVIGYVMLMAAMFVALTGMLFIRSYSKLSYAQDNYIRIYREMERIEMQKQFEEHAQVVAHQNVHAFLEKETRPKAEWDYISTVPGLTPNPTPSHSPTGCLPSLSPLNHLVRQEQEADKEQEREATTRHPAIQTQTSMEYVKLQDMDENKNQI